MTANLYCSDMSSSTISFFLKMLFFCFTTGINTFTFVGSYFRSVPE